MIPSQIAESVFALPEKDRLELARQIVESVTIDRRVNELVAEGIQRMEDVVTGKRAACQRAISAAQSDDGPQSSPTRSPHEKARRARRASFLVDPSRVELLTSSMPLRRSAN
jgi:hypothetical protein